MAFAVALALSDEFIRHGDLVVCMLLSALLRSTAKSSSFSFVLSASTPTVKTRARRGARTTPNVHRNTARSQWATWPVMVINGTSPCTRIEVAV